MTDLNNFSWPEEPVMEAKIRRGLFQIGNELKRAFTKFPGPQHSAHEGYAVLLEEVDELWDEIKANLGHTTSAQKEAIQVAAMALRYMLEVTS
jgi:hypothetical protein